MKSINTTLEFLGNEYKVLYSEYKFSRNTDIKGKPSSNIRGGRIAIAIESTCDNFVLETMLKSESLQVDGKIVYKQIMDNTTMKEIEFKNAYIVHCKEVFDAYKTMSLITNVTFSAEIISIDSHEFNQRWK